MAPGGTQPQNNEDGSEFELLPLRLKSILKQSRVLREGEEYETPEIRREPERRVVVSTILADHDGVGDGQHPDDGTRAQEVNDERLVGCLFARQATGRERVERRERGKGRGEEEEGCVNGEEI